MGTLSTWELRKRLAEDGGGVSDSGIADWVKWGILRKPEDRRWSEADVTRARRARALASDVRSLPRRALVLYHEDPTYPMRADKLRAAMQAVAPTVTAPVRKVRRIEEASRLRYEASVPARAVRRSQSRMRRFPEKQQWSKILDRFSDPDFERMVQYTRSEAIALHLSPAVQHAGILATTPFEEVWLLLTLMQLRIGSREHDETSSDPQEAQGLPRRLAPSGSATYREDCSTCAPSLAPPVTP